VQFGVGLMLPAPRFSKHLHGTASLFPDSVEGLPYWFVDNNDGTLSPATWEEMAATEDPYDKVRRHCFVALDET
jgi:SPX domain protein involved in polyphosphate accumulation